MLGDPVSALLAVALVPVVAYCAYRLIRRPARPEDDPVPVDVVAWHALMGAVMLAALLVALPPVWDWLAVGTFVLATVWAGFRSSNPRVPHHSTRLLLMSAAMVAMLLPSGAATAAPVTQAEAMPAMPGMDMPGTGGSSMLVSGAAALVVALTMALVAVAAARTIGRRTPLRVRLSACCEVVMAGSMVVMAAAMI